MTKAALKNKEDENLKRMLKMPPKPHVAATKRKAKSNQDRESNPKKKPA
jgi:hypothetical protein